MRQSKTFKTLDNQFGLLAAMFAITFAVFTNPLLALSSADKNWDDLEKSGIAALDANDYGIAEQLLRKALAQSKDFRPSDMRLAKSFAELGRLYTIRGQFSKAALYFEAELKVKEQLLSKKQYECIPTIASLIQFYFNHGMQHKSDPLTEKMLALIDNRSKKNQVPVIEWAISCDAVGDCYYSANNFTLADKLFRTALNIKTTLLSRNHLSLANSYERLGNLNLKKNDPNEAERYFFSALRITEKILPPESHEVYMRLDKLAKCLILQKKFDQAEKLYLQEKNVTQDLKSDERTNTLFALGCLYTDEHKYKLAQTYFQQTLELAKLYYGANSSTLTSYREKMALVTSAQHQTAINKESTAASQKSDKTDVTFVLVTQKNL